jgi:hypothetical protein
LEYHGLAKHPAFRAFPLVSLILLAASLGGCGTSPFGSMDMSSRSLSERECLARVMYFESNRSSEDGMLAVGTVVMNRLDDPRYPKTVCGVVGQPQQFAEGALTKPVNPRLMARAERVADAVLEGRRHEKVASAKFFHTAGMSFPYRNMHYLVLAGGNAFYEKRTPGTFVPATPAEKGITTTQFASAERASRLRPIEVAEAEPAPMLRPVRFTSTASPLPAPHMAVALAPASKPHPMQVAKASAPPALAFKPRAMQVAAAQPKAGMNPAPKSKPIVLAMLSEKRVPLPPSRSIADLIASDAKRR